MVLESLKRTYNVTFLEYIEPLSILMFPQPSQPVNQEVCFLFIVVLFRQRNQPSAIPYTRSRPLSPLELRVLERCLTIIWSLLSALRNFRRRHEPDVFRCLELRQYVADLGRRLGVCLGVRAGASHIMAVFRQVTKP